MKNKIVIFTALIGEYDVINQPIVVDERFDFVLFTDMSLPSRIGVWQVRAISYWDSNKTKIARWVKTHPEYLLPEYDSCLWIDASIVINSNYIYEKILNFCQENVLIATMRHPFRNCIYDEIYEVLNLHLETEECLINWGNYLKKNKYPENMGLSETGLLFRYHKKKEIETFDQIWWECIEKYSTRDQLSFDYVLWREDIEKKYIFMTGENIYNTSKFKFNSHICGKKKKIERDWSDTVLMKYCNNRSKEKIKKILMFVYNSTTPLFLAFFLGQCFRFYDALLYRLKRFWTKKRTF